MEDILSIVSDVRLDTEENCRRVELRIMESGYKAGKRFTGFHESLAISRLRSQAVRVARDTEGLCWVGEAVDQYVTPVGRDTMSLVSAAQCLCRHCEAWASGAAS